MHQFVWKQIRFTPRCPTVSDGIVMGLAVFGICLNVLMILERDVPKESVEMTYEPMFAVAMLDLDDLSTMSR